MRIIGGKYKGKKFEPPKNFDARPTTDFAKEALFNVLNNIYNFENLEVLDLFSGTGSISYEFLSRGTKIITAVENKPKHVAYIIKQFELLHAEQVNVIKIDAFKYLNNCKRKFDIIFADPPYNEKNIIDIYNFIYEKTLLKEDSLLIIEHSEIYDFSKLSKFKEMRKYGSVHFSFFET